MEMSTYNHFLELSNQLCYVQCSYCTTVLLVSVPCSSLLKMVTVRCGHCTGLLSVNMMKASFLPLQFLASLDDIQKQDLCEDSSLKSSNGFHPLTPSLDNGEENITVAPTVNKPPEKRQRAPSAYNRFIKEEIQRLKAREPNITHKEAFSTAAKNWAHFPRIQYKGDGESCNREMGAAKMTAARAADAAQGNVQCKGIDEMKATRHSLWTKTPLE